MIKDNKDKAQLLERAGKIARRVNRNGVEVYSSDIYSTMCDKYGVK